MFKCSINRKTAKQPFPNALRICWFRMGMSGFLLFIWEALKSSMDTQIWVSIFY